MTISWPTCVWGSRAEQCRRPDHAAEAVAGGEGHCKSHCFCKTSGSAVNDAIQIFDWVKTHVAAAAVTMRYFKFEKYIFSVFGRRIFRVANRRGEIRALWVQGAYQGHMHGDVFYFIGLSRCLVGSMTAHTVMLVPHALMCMRSDAAGCFDESLIVQMCWAENTFL